MWHLAVNWTAEVKTRQRETTHICSRLPHWGDFGRALQGLLPPLVACYDGFHPTRGSLAACHTTTFPKSIPKHIKPANCNGTQYAPTLSAASSNPSFGALSETYRHREQVTLSDALMGPGFRLTYEQFSTRCCQILSAWQHGATAARRALRHLLPQSPIRTCRKSALC